MSCICVDFILGRWNTVEMFLVQGWAWRTICLMLRMASAFPLAFNLTLEALVIIVKDGMYLTATNFSDCLITGKHLIEQASEDRGDVAAQIFVLMEDMVRWLPGWRLDEDSLAGTDDATSSSGLKTPEQCWSEVIKSLCAYCLDDNEMVGGAWEWEVSYVTGLNSEKYRIPQESL